MPVLLERYRDQSKFASANAGLDTFNQIKTVATSRVLTGISWRPQDVDNVGFDNWVVFRMIKGDVRMAGLTYPDVSTVQLCAQCTIDYFNRQRPDMESRKICHVSDHLNR